MNLIENHLKTSEFIRIKLNEIKKLKPITLGMNWNWFRNRNESIKTWIWLKIISKPVNSYEWLKIEINEKVIKLKVK